MKITATAQGRTSQRPSGARVSLVINRLAVYEVFACVLLLRSFGGWHLPTSGCASPLPYHPSLSIRFTILSNEVQVPREDEEESERKKSEFEAVGREEVAGSKPQAAWYAHAEAVHENVI